LSKDIEKWGSGLRRIYTACAEAKVKVEFRLNDAGFSVVFYRPDWVGEKVGEKVGETMTTNQEKMLRCIVDNPRISAKELSAIVRISSRKIEANIAKLKEKGVLSRVGPDKGGRWEVRR
jgi:ATP-dependent DNA helicase RecG